MSRERPDDPRRVSRIIHVASGREWRGGQHQVLLLARGLHRHGIDTTVVTGAGTALAGRLQAAGAAVAAVAWTVGLDPRVAIRLAGLLSRDTIVHAHDSHSHALADLVTRLRPAPLVVSRRVAVRVRSWRRYRRADALIAISRAVRQRLLDAGVDPGRIHVIPDAIDPDDAAANDTGGTSAPRSADLPLIVCVAALTREKGIDILLDAAALVRAANPRVRWQVIGEGPERGTLEAQRHRLGLEAVVELSGAGASAATAFRDATIAVQPSRSEGLGSAVLQALALGIPVIATDAGGLPDAIGQGGGLLVPAESPVELARAVQRLLSDSSERERLGADGRVAAGYFSLEKLVERTVDVYRSIAHFRDS